MGPIGRRGFLGGLGIGLLMGALETGHSEMKETSASQNSTEENLINDLVAANHILADQGIVDGYGHVSARDDRNPNRYLLARSLAPELVAASDILEFDLDSNPIQGKGPALYIERFIHGEIYKVRPDVKAIIHSHSPAVIPFGVTPVALRPVYHMAAFLGEGVPVFEIRKTAGMTDMLVRDAKLGQALATTLGSKPAALMRGHGAVIVGPSLPMAVGRSVYLEINARIQSQAMAMAKDVVYLAPEEAHKVAIDGYQRAWELWKRKTK